MRRFIFVSAAIINYAGDKERVLLDFSAYDEFKHPSIFGVCALLFYFIKNKQTKNDSVFILPVFSFYKIIIIIYANVHVTIT